MALLGKDALKAARKFLQTQGRPLELTRYDYVFGDASQSDVLEALVKFQNKDGGFGNALEPDLRAPESSALCTSIAFQLFRELSIPTTHELPSRAKDFLVKTFDAARQYWRSIPEEAEMSPRAPWWYQSGRMEKFDEFSLNPTAEILGYLYEYGQQAPTEILTSVCSRVLSELQKLDKIEMHDLLCCLRLFQTSALPVHYRDQVEGRIRQLIGDTVSCDPQAWRGYSLRPLQVASTPESPFVAGLEEAVAANLDYEISAQNADGSWTPTWSWDDTYPDEWEKAKTEWSGVITIEKLLTLQRFGRIEG